MKKHLAFMGVLSLVTYVTTPAQANDYNNNSWYISASGDISSPQNSSVSGTATGNVNYGFSSGGNLALGYETGPFRTELEGGYHALGLKNVTVGGATTSASSDMKMTTLMVNGYYDFHNSSAFTPYIGAGLGWAHLNFPTNLGFGNTKGSDNRLAYQAMIGVSYTPPSMPNTDWFAGYHFLGTSSPSFATNTGSISVKPIRDHSFEVGFRYHF